VKLKLSRYVAAVERDNSLLLYNALNGALLRFTDADKLDTVRAALRNGAIDGDEDSEVVSELKKRMYVFAPEIDEVEAAKQLYIDNYRSSTMMRLMFYVTNACNFRCVYCPQPHTEEYMLRETMDSICNMLETRFGNAAPRALSVSWFGGEPLLNQDIVFRGMERLSELCEAKGVRLFADMTTNAYGLNPKTFERLIKLGVNSFQITLDGTKETHDANRFTRSGEGTWERIWNHLLYINSTEYDFKISLRVNVSPESAAEAAELIDLKRKTFDDRVTLQIQPIMNMGGLGQEGARYCSEAEAQQVRTDMYAVLGRLGDEGFSRIEHIMRPFGLMCSCANPDYMVIRTDGKICKCELLIDDEHNIIGELSDGKLTLDRGLAAQYTAPSSAAECLSCGILPLCFGLSCPHRKSLKGSCNMKGSFDLENHIKLLADGLTHRRAQLATASVGAADPGRPSFSSCG
jgi:uncharacterized protein